MKYKLGLLLISPVLLTSCQMGGPSSVIIPLSDGSTYAFTSKQLSQDDYLNVVELLNKPSQQDYTYSLTLNEFAGESWLRTTKGEYASYDLKTSDNSKSVFFFTSTLGNCFYVASQYSDLDLEKQIVNLRVMFDYGTYNRSLDYGGYNKSGNGWVEISSNPNIPISYPTPDQDIHMKTSRKDYLSMHRTMQFLEPSYGFLRTNGIETLVFEYDSGDRYEERISFVDKPTYSHKITSKYLVIKEKRKGPGVKMPNEVEMMAYASLMSKNKNLYYNSTYFYNYKTGLLEKVEGSFNTIDSVFVRNTEISMKYTLKYQNRDFAQIKNKFDEYTTKFFSYPGIITNRSENEYQEY